MSRSNPSEDAVHPCKRWFEWDGATGNIRYYDKETKENVKEEPPFTFVLLDKLCVIRGWHEPSKSGITSNEVKSIRDDVLTVKAFKGGVLAKGYYSDIKDTVKAAGGHFTLNLYIAFHVEQKLEICSLQLKGKALSDWMEFEKKNRTKIFKKAIRITGSYRGQKGPIVYEVPMFELHDLSDATNDEATELDVELQRYLRIYYLSNPSRTEPESAPVTGPEPPEQVEEDEIPF